mmetsp:Transcript_28385/g.45986  ORF Transcript_28385/g.45986 Transcript_28385/m.45986 type:complete len:249 (-) Transcript_28385:2398-3144(-)
MHLVEHHVLQLLIIDRTHENVGGKGLPCDARRYHILPRIVEPSTYQHFTQRRHRVSCKCRAVMLTSFQHTGLSSKQLNHLPNCHARREAVGIHNQIRADAQVVERHVLLAYNQPNHTFLAVSRAELVAQLRPTCTSNQDFDKQMLLLIARQHHLVHHCIHASLVHHSRRLVCRVGQSIRGRNGIGCVEGSLFVDVNITGVDDLPRSTDSIVVNDLQFLGSPRVLIGRGSHKAVKRLIGVLSKARIVLP